MQLLSLDGFCAPTVGHLAGSPAGCSDLRTPFASSSGASGSRSDNHEVGTGGRQVAAVNGAAITRTKSADIDQEQPYRDDFTLVRSILANGILGERRIEHQVAARGKCDVIGDLDTKPLRRTCETHEPPPDVRIT